MNYFQRYRELFGKDLEQYREIELLPCIRVNTLKTTARRLIPRLKKRGVILQPIPHLDNGYRVLKSPFSLGATSEYLQGQYYMQEAAAQVPVQLLKPKPGDTVLDMAAAPGGKTTQLAQYMNNQGVIVAIDVRHKRLFALMANISRCGVTNTLVYNKDARFVNDFNFMYDKIVCDAPCSGNFMGDKSWLEKNRTVLDFETNSKVQRQLLKSAAGVLRSGGTMVYSTCSLEPEENEHVVEWAEKNLPLKVIQMHRFWPPSHQGFFVALLRKA